MCVLYIFFENGDMPTNAVLVDINHLYHQNCNNLKTFSQNNLFIKSIKLPGLTKFSQYNGYNQCVTQNIPYM